MIRDRDRIYGTIVTRRLRAMGIRDKPIAPASPWQNGSAERLKEATGRATSANARAMTFRSTPPRGGRPRAVRHRRSPVRSFDPRPRAGGDLADASHAQLATQFRSTPPCGGRPRRRSMSVRRRVFRSTPPRGGRPSSTAMPPGDRAFRSTPPCGGRRLRRHASPRVHASFDPRPRARGRRLTPRDRWPSAGFDPRPRARGRLRRRTGGERIRRCFDPRPRARGRPRAAGHRQHDQFRSTPP